MRNAGGELTDGFELLRLQQCFLGSLPLGDLRGEPVICGGETAGSLGDQPFQLLPAALQGLPRLDDVGDVSAGAEPSDGTAVVPNRGGARLEPPVLAVRATDPKLQIVIVPAMHRRQPALPNALPILRMDDLVEPGEPKLLFLSDAGVLDPLPAEIVTLAIRPAGPHQLRQRFGQGAIAALTGGQRLESVMHLELAPTRAQGG